MGAIPVRQIKKSVWTLKTLIPLIKRKKSAFVCVHQRPDCEPLVILLTIEKL
jgi:hypothetical protein